MPKYIKLPPELGGKAVHAVGDNGAVLGTVLAEWLRSNGAKLGDTVTLTIIEMDHVAFEALPQVSDPEAPKPTRIADAERWKNEVASPAGQAKILRRLERL